MPRTIPVCVAIAVVAVLVVPAAAPWRGARGEDDIIDQRRRAMKYMASGMKSIGNLLTGRENGALAETVSVRGRSIAAIGGRLPSLFPYGTGLDAHGGRTGARPEIWQRWGDFERAAAVLVKEAGRMTEAAEEGDPRRIKAAMEDMARNGCGACHRTFRSRIR